jgi:hypothetical protein
MLVKKLRVRIRTEISDACFCQGSAGRADKDMKNTVIALVTRAATSERNPTISRYQCHQYGTYSIAGSKAR